MCYTADMLKIWAKTIVREKITRDLMYIRAEKFFERDFHTHLMEICHELDIPTPVVLKSHKQNFMRFNITKFRASDFVESVDFEYLQLENASE